MIRAWAAARLGVAVGMAHRRMIASTSIESGAPAASVRPGRELLIFGGLAFVISWGIWGGSALIAPGDPAVTSLAGLAGSFGPALAALIQTARAPGQRTRIAPRTLGVFVLAALGLSLLMAHALGGAALGPAGIGLAGLTVCLAAGVLASPALEGDLPRVFARRIAAWRIGPVWYAAALLAAPAVLGLSMLAAHLAGSPTPAQSDLLAAGWPALAGALLTSALFGGPLGEEPGWRGYALPRLQQRFSPLVASLILSAIWAAWHAPLHIVGFYPGGLGGLAARFVWTVPVTLFLTWLYNGTQGNLLLCILAHASINFSTAALPVTGWSAIGLAIALLLAVIGGRMWRPLNAPAGAVPASGEPSRSSSYD